MRSILVILILFTLASCSRNSKKVVIVHPDGYYKEVYFVKDDSVKHGEYIKYYGSGNMADSCYYVNGKINGERHIYSSEGNLEILETYDAGTFEGPYKSYYPSGKLKLIQQYTQNKIQGEVKQFYENGNVKAIVQFVDNLENGPFTEYFENGNPHWEGFYEGGDFEQDTLKEFNENGVLIRKLFCEKGICQTVWTPEKGYIQPKKIFDNQE